MVINNTIFANAHDCICDYIMMDPNFNHANNYNLWLSQV
jgi:hypothetical protein